MFYNCSKLITLNIGSFNTSFVENMNSMLYSCSSLISLDLSNFDATKVTNMYGMFYNCNNLKFLDLNNFRIGSSFVFCDNMMYGCNSIICIKNYDNLLSSFKTAISSNKNNCSDICFINKEKNKFPIKLYV